MKTLLLLLGFTGALCFAQQNSPQDMKGMNMPGHDMSKMSGQNSSTNDSGEDADASMPAMHSMEGHHMGMGPHMKMTALRAPQSGDAEKAQKVVVAARAVMEKYKDYHVALNEGFAIFHPEVPQKQYHFTNYRYAFEADCISIPSIPPRCSTKKSGDDYRLVGVMYTAPKRFTEDDLNQRIPLSIAQWHEHVNFCRAPDGPKERNVRTESGIRLERLDHHAAGVRGQRRRISSHYFQLDGASLSTRKRRCTDLVGRSPTRRLKHRVIGSPEGPIFF